MKLHVKRKRPRTMSVKLAISLLYYCCFFFQYKIYIGPLPLTQLIRRNWSFVYNNADSSFIRHMVFSAPIYIERRETIYSINEPFLFYNRKLTIIDFISIIKIIMKEKKLLIHLEWFLFLILYFIIIILFFVIRPCSGFFIFFLK